MKTFTKLLFSLVTSIVLLGCDSGSMNDADQMMRPADAVEVDGPITVLRTGSLLAQSGTSTKGMVQLVEAKDGKLFLRLTEDFTSKFTTGTVTVYLSTSNRLKLAESDSFQLVSIVGKSGEHFFSLTGPPSSKFTHGIIWCGAAAIPFGFAELK
ncbi:hypothetical protein SAMN04489724_0467 [Algoriphagus locisalis]|uniref:DM13 domain-containing protein n=1 Tax=Algoriphagus locisalis TaxID=305507 RepID=A0A1I6XGZ6_9BACT|nr:hypothetical protein [Algoriphagus locisalis]SFT37373.1 hypothetical protein SAMN04489724_0467 [Algoriphagus locisalis]